VALSAAGVEASRESAVADAVMAAGFVACTPVAASDCVVEWSTSDGGGGHDGEVGAGDDSDALATDAVSRADGVEASEAWWPVGTWGA
jgi:hypothetical protein